MFILYCV